MIRINKTLALFSSLFLLLGILLVTILQKLSPLIAHATYYCQSFISENMIPIPYYLSIIPFAVLLVIVAIAIIKILLMCGKVKTLKSTLKKDGNIDKRIITLIKNLGLENQVTVITSSNKFAFCLGIRIPRIYISTGLLSELNLQETKAVLLHEQYHLQNYDTFIMIIASVVYSLFPFFPVLGDLIQKYRIEREIQADNFAVDKIGTAFPLLSALKKLLILPTVQTVPVVAIADLDTLEPRIHSLIHNTYRAPHVTPLHIFITLFSACIAVVLLITPVHAQEVHHQQHDVMMVCTEGIQCIRSCTSEQNMNKLYSELPSGYISTEKHASYMQSSTK